MKGERARPKPPAWTMWVLHGVLALLYLPMLVMLVNSLVVPEGETAWRLGFDWYTAIVNDGELLSALSRSLVVGLSASLIAAVVGSGAAIALAKSNFRFGRALNGLSFLSLIIPELVFALALLSWFFVLKIPLSLVTVVLAHVTFSLSFVLLTVNGRIGALDPAIDDAARDLGASEWLILRRITLPLLAASIVSGFLLAFLLSFDDFLITFYTSGVGSDTLPIRLYAAMKIGLSPKLSALATLMMFISVAVITALVRLKGLRAIGSSET